jgi:hypothetical protein
LVTGAEKKMGGYDMTLKPMGSVALIVCASAAAHADDFTVNEYYVTGDCTKDEFTVQQVTDGYNILATLASFRAETPYYGGRGSASCDLTLDVTHGCGGCVKILNASWEGFADIAENARGFASASFYVDATRVDSDPTMDTASFDGPMFDMFYLETGEIEESLASEGSLVLSAYAKLRVFGPASSMDIDRQQTRLVWRMECCEE